MRRRDCILALMVMALGGGGCGEDTSTANLPNIPPMPTSTQPPPQNPRWKGPTKGWRKPRPPGAIPVPGGGPKSRDNPGGLG